MADVYHSTNANSNDDGEVQMTYMKTIDPRQNSLLQQVIIAVQNNAILVLDIPPKYISLDVETPLLSY